MTCTKWKHPTTISGNFDTDQYPTANWTWRLHEIVLTTNSTLVHYPSTDSTSFFARIKGLFFVLRFKVSIFALHHSRKRNMLQQNKENTSENLSFDYIYINKATKFKLFRPWFNFYLPSDVQVMKFHGNTYCRIKIWKPPTSPNQVHGK